MNYTQNSTKINGYINRSYTLTIPDCPDLRLALISDLHEKKISESDPLFTIISSFNPDRIIFAGDMISRTTTDFSSFDNICALCKDIAPVCASVGNHEQTIQRTGFKKYLGIINNYKIDLLDNDRIIIIKDKKRINITGLTLSRKVYKNNDGSYYNLPQYTCSDIINAVGRAQCGYNILIAHNPKFFDAYSDWGADLVLCGHMHGGIIRFPHIGGLLSPERKLFPPYSLGIYQKNKTFMTVSAGLGKFRLFNPPEITFITIKNQ